MLTLKRTLLVALLIFSCGAPPAAPPGCTGGALNGDQATLGYSANPLISLGRSTP